MPLARHKLPQIPKREIPDFIRYLQTKSYPEKRLTGQPSAYHSGGNQYNVGFQSDVAVEAAKIPAKFLKPIQKHVDIDKVKGMLRDIDKIKNDVFIVDKDNRILDGHHRWLAILKSNPQQQMRVIRVHLPIGELVRAAHEFEGSHIRKLGEIKRAN